jgi:hypothetical protein
MEVQDKAKEERVHEFVELLRRVDGLATAEMELKFAGEGRLGARSLRDGYAL